MKTYNQFNESKRTLSQETIDKLIDKLKSDKELTPEDELHIS